VRYKIPFVLRLEASGKRISALQGGENVNDSVSSVIHRERNSMEKLNKAERHARGLFKTQRWYNTRWRVCLHLEDKLRRLARETRKYRFTRVGKSGLVSFVSFEDFSKDTNTACLAAYLAARMGRRSIFTSGKQDRAFDRMSAMLLARCERYKFTTRWDVLAQIMPDPLVIRRLSDEQRGILLGQWWAILADMASLLHEISSLGGVDLKTMVVTRGVDSTTWNTTASGWDQARAHWLSLVHALGLETILDEICPGKVMRLMAADVVQWHKATNDAALTRVSGQSFRSHGKSSRARQNAPDRPSSTPATSPA